MDRKRKIDLDDNTEMVSPSKVAHADGGIEESSTNPYTGMPHSSRYYEILSGRKGK